MLTVVGAGSQPQLAAAVGCSEDRVRGAVGNEPCWAGHVRGRRGVAAIGALPPSHAACEPWGAVLGLPSGRDWRGGVQREEIGRSLGGGWPLPFAGSLLRVAVALVV